MLRVVITVLILGLTFGGYYVWKEHQAAAQAKLMAAYQPPPVTVSTANVESRPWQRLIKTTGTLKAEKSVVLSAQAAGVLTQVSMISGQTVQVGDVLARIDALAEQTSL